MGLRSSSVFIVGCLAVGTSVLGAEVPWPAEALGTAVNLTSVEGSGTNDFYVNMSSAFWNPATRRLWVCRNGGPDGSKFWALREDGNGGFEVDVQGGLRGEWANFGDLEAVTQANYNEAVLFLLVEGEERIKECSVSTYGTAVINNNWNTSSYLPLSGGSGAEGLCFVPDSFLSAAGFVDQSGNPYVSHNGMGGLMFVAHQNGGRIYAFDLNRSNGTFTYVGAYKTNFSESCELAFDRSDGRMYILHGADHNTVEVTNLASTVVGGERQFTELVTYGRPTGSPGSWNLEGFAIMPNTDCANGQRSVFLAVDDGGANSLFWFKQFTCSCSAGDPNISVHPTPATICTGLANQFCVTTTGTGTLSYQWQKDGANVSGATASCYSATQAGSYRCVVSNSCGSTTSNAAALTLLSAPSVTSHPSGGTICSGQSLQVCVTATGSGALSYQWQRDGVNISGATASCYSATQAGSYCCVVSNSCGSTRSNSATLVVNTSPNVIEQPVIGSVCSGQTQQFCVTAAGTPPLSYQWQRDGTDIGGAAAACYTASLAGSYRCIVSNACGSATSNAASLTVVASVTWFADADGDGYGNPLISLHACDRPGGYVANGLDCNDFVASINPGRPELCDGIDNNCDGHIDENASADSDSDGVTDCVDACPATAAGQWVDTNGCSCAQLGQSAPVVSVQPGNASVCSGQSGAFCVSASGSGTLTYQWQKGGVNISGATGSCYTATQAGTYRCVVSNTCGSTTSSAASLAVAATVTWFADADGDGYGNSLINLQACNQPIGYVANGSDCNDADSVVHPGASDSCGADRDCDGHAPGPTTWYRDVDGDGYGDRGQSVQNCLRPVGYVANDLDCNDHAVGIHPGGSELCDGIDNNCDGQIDENGNLDSDGDGVTDCADACPNSNSASPVDSRGCTIGTTDGGDRGGQPTNAQPDSSKNSAAACGASIQMPILAGLFGAACNLVIRSPRRWKSMRKR